MVITFDEFSCKWGPLGLFLTKRGPTLETGASVLGLAIDAECCSAATSPKALPRYPRAGPEQHQTPRMKQSTAISAEHHGLGLMKNSYSTYSPWASQRWADNRTNLITDELYIPIT